MNDTSAEPQTIAGIEVIPLRDAVGPMGEAIRKPLDVMFPGGTPEIWANTRATAPEAFGPDGEWILNFHCFLLRIPNGSTVLVDTGLGGTDSPAASWAPVPGRLNAALNEVGLAPADVDVVVLTHLHSDHASGAVLNGAPAYPNARYLVQQSELEWLADSSANPLVTQTVRPLQAAGALDVVEGAAHLSPDVEIVPTPGHTPGHQSVIIDDHRLVVAGDVVLHPVQLADESVRYLYDEDPVTAAKTRSELLGRIRDRDGILAAPHLPAPFTYGKGR